LKTRGGKPYAVVPGRQEGDLIDAARVRRYGSRLPCGQIRGSDSGAGDRAAGRIGHRPGQRARLSALRSCGRRGEKQREKANQKADRGTLQDIPEIPTHFSHPPRISSWITTPPKRRLLLANPIL